MREQGSSASNFLDHPEAEPIVLMGPPGAIQGELRLRNPGAEKLILRDPRLRSEPMPAAPNGLEHTMRRIILRGGQARRVPVTFAINPHVSPGEYRAELQLGGELRAVVIHVTESVQLEITPSQLVLENRPGATQTKQVVFSNRGNVALKIHEIGPVVLDDELLQCRTHRAALAEAGDQLTGLDDYLAALGRKYKAAFETTGFLRVHNAGGKIVLQPGEVRAVKLEIRVPEKLDKRTRYFGRAAISTSDLEFVIVPA